MGFGTEYPGTRGDYFDEQLGTDRLRVGTFENSPPVSGKGVEFEQFLEGGSGAATRALENLSYPARLRRSFSGACGKNISEEWFDRVYVLPDQINTGILVSTQVFEITLYSSFRSQDVNWTAYDDSSAGAGVDLDSSPPGDVTFAPHSGATRTLTVTLNGPPSINGELEFTFDSGIGTLTIPITGTRSVLFPFEPEAPMAEILEFFTDILRTRSGKEQRRALRKTPRVTFDYQILTDEADRRLLENLIFDGQDRAFGVPHWFQATALTSPVAADDTTINVISTADSDYRAGGLAVVWTDPFTFEALQIASFDGTSVTFESPFTTTFPLGSRVMPVSSAFMRSTTEQERYRNNLQRNRFQFQLLDNDIDIADVSAYSSYTPTGGTERVLLDDSNFVPGDTIRETWNRNIVQIDGDTGAVKQFTDQTISRKGSSKGFVTTNKADLQNVRQLLHALRGRAVSFYIPTFYPDFVPVADIASADQAIDVSAVNYVDSIQSRQPRNIIRVVKTDGTTSDPKLVTGASIPSEGTERLSIATDTVGINASVAEVDRIEYIEKVRIDTDTIRIQHIDGNGTATVTFPVIAVLESDD